MFGYLPAPCHCQIGRDVDLYRSTFCGLCNAMASQYGQPARLLINRDATFLAMMTAAQSPNAPVITRSTRCQPWSRPMPVFEAGPAPAYAAAVTLCGLRAKLEDERVDEHGPRAAACRALISVSRSRFDRAEHTLRASGFPVAEVYRDLAGQSWVEKQVTDGSNSAEAALPSARAFGSILAHTARVAGNDRNVEPLYEAGHSLGTLIYALDAYRDLDDDSRRGRFNYFAVSTDGERADAGSVRAQARRITSKCQQQIAQAWKEVELLRFQPVLEAVLLTGLPSSTRRVLGINTGSPIAHSIREVEDEDSSFDQGSNACFCPGGDWTGCCYCCECCECADCDRDGSCCDCGGADDCCCNGDCNGCDCGDCDCGGCDCGGCDCGGCDCNC